MVYQEFIRKVIEDARKPKVTAPAICSFPRNPDKSYTDPKEFFIPIETPVIFKNIPVDRTNYKHVETVDSPDDRTQRILFTTVMSLGMYLTCMI